MAEVFLMGTAGKYDDPNRSKWREPIKSACTKSGVSYFDPVVPEWNDKAMQAEIDALRSARVVVMAVTADTAGIASLAESGWAALSAVTRRQAFGIYVDSIFVAEGFDPRLSQASADLMKFLRASKVKDPNVPESPDEKKSEVAELAEASRRARKLVDGHATELAKQFPQLNMYVANSLYDLATWTVKTALKMTGRTP